MDTVEQKETKGTIVRTRKINITVEIAMAAIFIGISAVVSAFLTPYIPRLPWGIALLDPISVVWLACFLMFGWRSGILCTVGGTVILFFFDPTGIGPFFKFAATMPLILVPLLLRFIAKNMGKTDEGVQSWCYNLKNYIPAMAIAYGVRITSMLMINASLFGWNQGVINFTLLINSWQMIFDSVLPYLFAFKVVQRYYCL